MTTRTVCVVITARPSYSRIKTALEAIRAHPKLKLQLVVAASALLDRYGGVVRQIELDGFDVAAKIDLILEGESLASMAKTTGLGMIELATAFSNLKPDVVVTVADRYETLATAIAASYMNIPVAHVQGGEITGSIDERVRHAVTKMSDIHFVATQRAAERVMRMGEDPQSVFVTGCPSIDLAAQAVQDPKPLDPAAQAGGVGPRLNLDKGYVVVVQHPVTSEQELARAHVLETLHAVNDLGMAAFWFWPNVDAGSDGTSKGIRMFRELVRPKNIHFFRSMSPMDFLQLVQHGKCIVGNSSAAIRECSYLNVPAVNIGSRQEGRERGTNVVDVAYERGQIAVAIRAQLKNGKQPPSLIYGDGRAGEKIAQLLAEQPLNINKRMTY